MGKCVEGNCVNGHGVYTWPTGDRYEGEWKDDKRAGHGVSTWPDGRRHEGEWKDGKQAGHGVFTLPNGDRYEGEWKDGKYTGHASTEESEWTNAVAQARHAAAMARKGAKAATDGMDASRQAAEKARTGAVKDEKARGAAQKATTSTGINEQRRKPKKMLRSIYTCAVLLFVWALWTEWTQGTGGICEIGNCVDGHGVFTWPDGRRYEGQWKDKKKNGHGAYS